MTQLQNRSEIHQWVILYVCIRAFLQTLSTRVHVSVARPSHDRASLFFSLLHPFALFYLFLPVVRPFAFAAHAVMSTNREGFVLGEEAEERGWCVCVCVCLMPSTVMFEKIISVLKKFVSLKTSKSCLRLRLSFRVCA